MLLTHAVTAENIEDVRAAMAALDQAAELEPGCATWGITYAGGQRGQMTIWPSGRGAIAIGGTSDWGKWENGILTQDATTEEGKHEQYNVAGEYLGLV